MQIYAEHWKALSIQSVLFNALSYILNEMTQRSRFVCVGCGVVI
jgi:hypothetical protein